MLEKSPLRRQFEYLKLKGEVEEPLKGKSDEHIPE